MLIHIHFAGSDDRDRYFDWNKPEPQRDDLHRDYPDQRRETYSDQYGYDRGWFLK